MKSIAIAGIVIMLAAFVPIWTAAQTPPPAPASGQRSLSSDLGMFVYPAKGQKPEQQSKDEVECYNWAVQSSGVDPFDLQKKKQQDQKQAEQAKQDAKDAGKGSGAKGAVGGAAAGALIGAVAGDAGKGAAIGATAGVISGRRRGRQAQAQAEQKADSQAKAQASASKEQMESFKKGFAVCLEARDYMVK